MKKKKEEFADDPMMKELHEIREQIAKEREGLSFEQWNRKMKKEVAEFLAEHGYQQIQTDRGTYKVVKKKGTKFKTRARKSRLAGSSL